ncbi:MAG: trypsin-like peptidase domain-containing protein [Actinomycetota bacterium]|nr:trypsin-like peptidase domain-containing protein [Actinomycetota bacterium]
MASIRLGRVLACLVVFLGGCGAPHIPDAIVPTMPANSPAASPLPPIEPGDDVIVEVVDRVRTAVVNVTTDVAAEDPVEAPGTGTGTGFIVNPNGVVVTNFHVVEGSLNIRVVTADQRRFEARVIGGDPDADLAVLQVEASGLPTVPLGDSENVRLGEQVVAIGFALALEGGPSVTSGIVSALDRTIQAGDEAGGSVRTYEDLLQTDAAINPGNSGGPLVDLSGRVIGINTAGIRAASAENIGFAIAIDRAKSVIEEAIADPAAPSPYLGVSTRDVTPAVAFQLDLPVDRGALVVDTAPGGPADEAGIRVGDIIVAMNGEPVESSDEVRDIILEHEPDQDIEVDVVREGGARTTITATLGVRPFPVPPS